MNFKKGNRGWSARERVLRARERVFRARARVSRERARELRKNSIELRGIFMAASFIINRVRFWNNFNTSMGSSRWEWINTETSVKDHYMVTSEKMVLILFFMNFLPFSHLHLLFNWLWITILARFFLLY